MNGDLSLMLFEMILLVKLHRKRGETLQRLKLDATMM